MSRIHSRVLRNRDPAGIFNVRLAAGILMVIFTAAVVLGGLRRIADAAFFLVPVMLTWYIILGLIGWALSGGFFDAMSKIFYYAFTPQAPVGGFAGATVYAAIRYGFARGLFSNEAGLGSAPLAYAYSESDHPGRQGFYGRFEVFMDTLVVCSITGVMVVATGAYETGLTGAALALHAFKTVYGPWASMVVGVGLALFAYATLLTWCFYGENTFVYSMTEKVKALSYRTAALIYRIAWLPPIIAASVAAAYLVDIWDLADTLNGLMAIPNLIAVVFLLPIALRLMTDFYARHLAAVPTATDGGKPSKIRRAYWTAVALAKAFKDFVAPSPELLKRTKENLR